MYDFSLIFQHLTRMCVPLNRVGLFHELSYKCPYTHMSYEINNSFMFIIQSIIENVTDNEMSTIFTTKEIMSPGIATNIH